MLPANSLDDIHRELDRSLGQPIRSGWDSDQERPGPGVIGYIVAGTPRVNRTENVRYQWSKIVGILFCPPNSPLGENELLKGLDYFHQRSGSFVDFFCVGYGAYWPPSHWPPGTKVVSKLGSTDWLFSPRHFNQARDEIEQKSKWSYSGETDLILTVARKSAGQPASVDLSNAIACNLEQMIRDQAISSMRAFFEQVFRFGEKYTGEDPVTRLSDKLGGKAGSNFLLEAVLTLVPESARNLYKSARHFAIRDISRA